MLVIPGTHQHAMQFERGQIGFKQDGAKWNARFYDILDEVGAYRAQARQSSGSDLSSGLLAGFMRDPRELSQARFLFSQPKFRNLGSVHIPTPRLPGFAPGAVVRLPGWFYVTPGR